MPEQPSSIAVYLERGNKKVVAGARNWPGWCRIGSDDQGALAALGAYAPRYARMFAGTRLAFTPPEDVAAYHIVETLQGGGSTDFGVPGLAPAIDAQPFDAADFDHAMAVLQAIWRELDRAAAAAEGHTLRKGPRGGGRDADAIVGHVVGAETGYLRSLGQKVALDGGAPMAEQTRAVRAAVRHGLEAALRGELPEKGPRGGKIWSPRYFVRRTAWHALDHAWEIEDRIEE